MKSAEEQCIEDNFVFILSVEQRKLYQIIKNNEQAALNETISPIIKSLDTIVAVLGGANQMEAGYHLNQQLQKLRAIVERTK